MSKTIHFYAGPLGGEQVDTVNGVIRGVSIITSGVIARGHDLLVDQKTLTQMQACAESKKQLPVKIDHSGGAGSVVGYLTNFKICENKLIGDLHLLSTHEKRDQLLEIAQRMPGGLGLSASFVTPENAEKGKARCAELLSADVVTMPAANPNGFFESKFPPSPRPRTSAERIARALHAAGRGAEVGSLGGTLAGILLRKRSGTPNVNATAATGAALGGLVGGAIQYRPDKLRDEPRDMAARVGKIVRFQQAATLRRLTDAVANNVSAPEIPGAEQANTAIRYAKKPLVRRAAARLLKVGAGSAIGYYAGKKIGAKSGAIAGAVAGALFSSPEVRSTVRLSIIHANKTNL